MAEKPDTCSSGAEYKEKLKLRWTLADKTAPCKMYCERDFCNNDNKVVVSSDTVYIMLLKQNVIYAYHFISCEWSKLPECPFSHNCSLAVVDDLLTTIGGHDKEQRKSTSKLFSFTKEKDHSSTKSWVEIYPPMPTERYSAVVVCDNKHLVVIGGKKLQYTDIAGKVLRGVLSLTFSSFSPSTVHIFKTVEIMDISTQQWHTAYAGLPEPIDTDRIEPPVIADTAATICGGHIYLQGKAEARFSFGYYKPLYSCSLSELTQLQSSPVPEKPTKKRVFWARSKSPSVWKRIVDLPAFATALVVLDGCLLAVGGQSISYRTQYAADRRGRDYITSRDEMLADVSMYDPAKDKWILFSKLNIPRRNCFVGALPNGTIMAVGGIINNNNAKFILTDTIEFAKIV